MRLILRLTSIVFFIATSSVSHAQIETMTGQLINGRGTIEKLERVRITVTLDNEVIGRTYTDSLGLFRISTTSVADAPLKSTPQAFAVHPNYPNPFANRTTIPFSLPMAGDVTISIFNIIGQQVRTLQSSHFPAGSHMLLWDGRDNHGLQCSNGIYFIKMMQRNQTIVHKMCLMQHIVPGGMTPNSRFGSMAKNTTASELHIQITDRDVADTTVTIMLDEVPTTLDAGTIHMHVHPFLRTPADTISVMTGEDALDTLDVYYERPVDISSTEIEISWQSLEDGQVAIHYHNIILSSATIRFVEVDGIKSSYAKAYFNRSARPDITQTALRRGYVGHRYNDAVNIRDTQGEHSLTLLTDVPQGNAYDSGQFSGTPDTTHAAPLYFELIDERSILVRDSVMLFIHEPTNIDLNLYALDILEEYPRDGTHPYSWVNTYAGVTRDLYYKGQKIASANPNGSQSCYCCGLTFEDFFRGITQLLTDLGKAEDINSMSAEDMIYFRHLWFVQSTWGDGPGVALEHFGIGDRVYDLQDVKKGDYLQFWRTTGSGHSVIFMNWVESAWGDTIGIRYWSTQTSTNGINFNIEYYDGAGGRIDPNIMFFSRMRSPETFTPISRSKLSNYDDIVSQPDKIVPKSFMKN